jgi:hypothetical protein
MYVIVYIHIHLYKSIKMWYNNPEFFYHWYYYIHTYARTYTHTSVRNCIRIYVYIYIHLYPCIKSLSYDTPPLICCSRIIQNFSIKMHVYMHMYIHSYAYIHTYTYMHIYTMSILRNHTSSITGCCGIVWNLSIIKMYVYIHIYTHTYTYICIYTMSINLHTSSVM